MTEPQDFDPTRYAADRLSDAGVSGVSAESGADPRALVDQAVALVAQSAPSGWTSVHGVFSMAGGEEIAKAVAVTPHNAVGFPVSARAAALIRRQREATVGPQGPWLRLLFDLDSSGEVKIAFDYGDQEIPADQLLPGEAYLRDFETHPRPDAAVWLLAHMGNQGQQSRSPAQARGDGGTRTAPRKSADEIPGLPQLWSRIAALAAVSRGSDVPIGPRTDPAFAVHLGENGGCTLARLPGNRAVLSGGRTDSVLLSQAYKGAIDWPDLYAGAPWWVHNLYLDPRAGRGMVSFCYWWDGQAWWRSELPLGATPTGGDQAWHATDEIVAGMPGVWTTETTAELVAEVLKRIGVELTDRNAYSALYLVRAAEAGVVSERYVNRLFAGGVPETFDTAEALAQFDAAGVLLPAYPPIDEVTAKHLVAQYCRAKGVDVTEYPLGKLTAARLDAGWQVFVPVEPGEIAIGRRFFMVADDRVVEEASTSVLPDDLALIFSTRFAMRIRGRDGRQM